MPKYYEKVAYVQPADVVDFTDVVYLDIDYSSATSVADVAPTNNLFVANFVDGDKDDKQRQHLLPSLAKTAPTKSVERLKIQMHNMCSETDTPEQLEQHNDKPVPDWVVVGESVLIRPNSTSGVIGFVEPIQFEV